MYFKPFSSVVRCELAVCLRRCAADAVGARVEGSAMTYVRAQSLQSHPTLCNPKGPTRLLCPWGSPGQNAGVGCHFLLQGIFPTHGSNLHLLPRQVDSFSTGEAHLECALFLCPEFPSGPSWVSDCNGYWLDPHRIGLAAAFLFYILNQWVKRN